jgi:tetratricopeptide (TPR) repeat protein
MIRLLTGALLPLVAGMAVISQTNAVAAPQEKAGSAQRVDADHDKPEMLRLIAAYEAAARDPQAKHSIASQVKIYSNLGILYEDAGMGLKAEDAVRRAIALLKNGPQDQLAEEIDQLAVLDVAMGKMGQAEKDELREMQIREKGADPVGIALAQNSLAGMYDEERKFAKALVYAERAYDTLANRADVRAPDRIRTEQTLGFALTGTRNCDRGIELLKDAFELARSSPEVNSLEVGYSEYVLGFGYWHCGDRGHASEWLERGTTDMRADYGWDKLMYVNAMKQFARFLRENGQREAAESAEAVVNQAESVVDASALTGRAEGFRPAGSK